MKGGKPLYIILAAVVVAAGALLYQSMSPGQIPRVGAREFTVEIRIFEDGSFSLKRITVNKGETVVLHLKAIDAVHGFRVEGYTEDSGPIAPGKTKTMTFVADRPGTFTFICTVVCSPLHPEQKGQLVVLE